MKHRLTAISLALAVGALGATSRAAPPPRPDPMREQQWGLDVVDAIGANQISTGNRVVIAILDSGIDTAHPDLRTKLVPGWYARNPGAPMIDHNGHGSAVAGVAAAATGNGVGIAGMAPGARIMPVRVLDRNGRGSLDDLAKGIRWAVDHGARVLNMSLGLVTCFGLPDLPTSSPVPDPLDPVRLAIDYAWSKGAVIVGAAGNCSIPACNYPADTPHVICVGSSDRRGMRSYYSQGDGIGEQQDAFLCAPGGSSAGIFDGNLNPTGAPEDILTTVARGGDYDYDGSGYSFLAGTSLAAPFVSGAAALLLARGLKNAQVVRRLLDSATPDPVQGRAGPCGYGILNAYAALKG